MPSLLRTPSRIMALGSLLVLAACATHPPAPYPGHPMHGPGEPAVIGTSIPPGTPPTLPGGAAGLPSGPGNPPFYEVMGERYYVQPDSTGYAEEGIASWYGREFHGRRTSNGEVYDMHAMTAAHKTLPLPTTARVTNLANGKSIIVRINDRGPFKEGRLIDLSYGAARELGFLAAGTTRVEVVALPDEPATTAARAAGGSRQLMYAQVGAFSQQANAEELQRRLRDQGLDKVVIHPGRAAGRGLYRVRIGPVADAGEFDAVAAAVSRMQLGTPQLVVEADNSQPDG